MKISIFFFFSLFSILTNGQESMPVEKILYKKIVEETNPSKKVINYASLINYYFNQEQHAAENSLKEELYRFLEIEDLPFQGGIEALNKGNLAENIDNDYKAALEHAIQAMIFFEELANDYPDIQGLTARAAMTCATLSCELGDRKDAFHYYKVANRIGKELNDLEIIGMVENGLGVLHSEFGDFKSSIPYFQTSLRISTEINDFQGRLISLYNLAEVHYFSNNIDSAFIFLDRTLAIRHQDTSVLSMSNLLQLKAKLLLSNGKIDEAESQVNQALEISLKHDNTYISKFNYQLLGEIFYQRKQFDKAETYFRKSIDLEPKETNVTVNSNLYFSLAKTMEAQKKYVQSQQLYKKAFQLRESIYQDEKMGEMIDLHDQFEVQEFKDQQAKLSKDKKLIQLALNSRTKQLIGSVIFGIILLLMAVYIRFQMKSLKDAYQILVKKNRQLVQNQVLPSTLPITKKEALPNIEVVDNKDTILLDNLFIQFETALKKDMIFKDKNITLTKLSEIMGTNRSYLSKMINQKYGKNFNTLLNEYRVNLVLKYFEENQHLKYTLETLSEKAGFKSRSVFNKSFKRHTGLSPSHYIKNLGDD